MSEKSVGILAGFGGLLLFLLAVLFLTTVKIVSAGHVGVVTTWGAVSTTTLEPGFHLVVPIAQDVHQLSTQVQAHSF